MTTTITGNITRDPELRFIANGKATVSFGVAVTRKWKTEHGEQEQTSFFNVVAWGTLAENVAASLNKGHRVIVTGRLEQRSYDTKEGEKKSIVEIVADEIGPSLRWARTEIERIARDGGGAGGAGGAGGSGGGSGASSGGSRVPDPVYGDEEPF